MSNVSALLAAGRASMIRNIARPVQCLRCHHRSSVTSLWPSQHRTMATDSHSGSSSTTPPPPSPSSQPQSQSQSEQRNSFASSASPSSSTSAFSPSSRSLTDILLGVLSGVTLFYGIDWLLYWPEPLSGLQSLLDSDPLLQSAIGSPVRVSPLWTGNVRESESFSVSLPVSGSKGSGRVFARGVYDGASRQWKLVYLQAAVGGLQQRHTLHILPHMDVRGVAASGTVPSAGALVMPANFNPTLLPPEQFVKYQEFLKQHGMQEWRPDPATEAQQKEQSSSDATTSSSSSSSNTTQTQTQPAAG